MSKATLYIPTCLVALFLVASCASIGTPSGGPRDEDPPRFLTASPPMGATDVNPNKIVLTFDELVTLKDAFSKVVVSPPGSQVPRVSSLGRRVNVEFRDTLLPNTTYTVDFGDAIADNNEGNQLQNFIYTFSTGPTLDSLMISGMVLGASDLAPASGMYVGLHTNLEDSAFTKTRFDRIAKTDNEGRFVIGGLAPGTYRVYALEDKDGDLAWSSPEESLAFYDAVVSPYTETTVTTDTLFNLYSGTVDSTAQRQRTRFLPNNILLRSFNTGFRQQYISKYERQDSTRIDFIFNAPADTMARFDFILKDGSVFPAAEVAVTERSAFNDTITFWLKDAATIASDTLKVAVEYLRPDSAYVLQPVNDTLRLLSPRPVAKAKPPKAKKNAVDTVAPPLPTIAFTTVGAKTEINQPFVLETPTPLESFDVEKVRLEFKEDTLWLPAPDFDVGTLVFDSLNPRRLSIAYPWKFSTTYKLSVDSLAGKDIYGVLTDAFSQEFSMRDETEYGSLKFNITNVGPDTIPKFVQLLDASGKPIRKKILENRSVTFEYLLPGTYNVRVVQDLNGNGIWDPGNFQLGIQPDVSYYHNESIELKPNWDQEIDWNVFATPVDKMLPQNLRKSDNKNRR